MIIPDSELKEYTECPHGRCGLTVYNKDCKRETEYEGDGIIKVLRDAKICSKCGRDIEINYWIK